MVTQPDQDGAQDSEPLYIWVARRATSWNDSGNVGLVVGAPYPDELRRVREICGDMPILIPGVGVQQGPVGSAVDSGVDQNGRNAVINVSRSVIYASDSPLDFDEAAGRNASGVRKMINDHLTLIGKGWPELTAVQA
jgi:orotidine-5'-phosphate decarboxylase